MKLNGWLKLNKLIRSSAKKRISQFANSDYELKSLSCFSTLLHKHKQTFSKKILFESNIIPALKLLKMTLFFCLLMRCVSHTNKTISSLLTAKVLI